MFDYDDDDFGDAPSSPVAYVLAVVFGVAALLVAVFWRSGPN